MNRGIDWGGLVTLGIIAGVGTIIAVCVVAGAASIGGVGDSFDNILNDRASAHTERMREMDTEQERQNAREAEALAQEARAQVSIERERAAQELAKQRQREYEVEWERAAGDRSEAEANAYTTERMADAAYHAIQRQGRLLSLSVAQQYFFGGVMGLSLLAVVALVLVMLNERKMKQ